RLEVRLAGEYVVERLELLRGFGEQGGSLAARARRERDAPAKERRARLLELVQRPDRRHLDELVGRAERAGDEVRLRGGERALRPARRGVRELGRAPPGRRRGRHPAAGPRAAGPAPQPARRRL